MADKKDDDGDEQALWRAAMRDVVPLAPVEAPVLEEAPPPPQKRLRKVPPRVKDVPPLAPPPARAALNPGLDTRMAEKFRRGKMPIEAVLDLHGYSRSAAYAALNVFIQGAYASKKRCVLVITGKGGGLRDPLSPADGVLKASVPEWLAEPVLRGYILKTALARPNHGGAGALYVLLRRRRGAD
ncbi:MAG: Smr/MutS family protein [Alphaproteobacteria bacterium]|nr:Smr/MutS family protein [Alphaproteobacteria bacterium]